MTDEIFYVVGDPYPFTVPEWYEHDKIFDSFQKEVRINVSQDVTSEHYPEASYRLMPGMKVKVRVLGIRKYTTVTAKGCVEYLQSQDAELVNVHGLMLAFMQVPELFTGTFSYKSLDTKLRLYADTKNNNAVRHPYLHVRDGTPANLGHAVYKNIGVLSRLLMFRILG